MARGDEQMANQATGLYSWQNADQYVGSGQQLHHGFEPHSQRSLNANENGAYADQVILNQPSTNLTDHISSARGRSNASDGDNYNSQNGAPAGIHLPLGHHSQRNALPRPPLGAGYAAHGRTPTESHHLKTSAGALVDPITSFNEENDVYEISSLFDDVKNNHQFATYQALRRDTDPGDEPVLDLNRINNYQKIGAS